jgi:hypothetical protein
MGLGKPTAVTAVPGSAPVPGCGVPSVGTAHCEFISIAEASGGTTTGTLHFGLESPTGQLIPFATVVLLNESWSGIALYNGSTGSWTACTDSSCHVTAVSDHALPVPISSLQTIVLETAGGTSSPPLTGDTFTVSIVGGGQTDQTLA